MYICISCKYEKCNIENINVKSYNETARTSGFVGLFIYNIMAFIRTHKNRDYTVMCNHHLNNEQLSLKAKGLLSFMLSKPDNWEFSISGLKSQLKEGKSAIRSTLIEIEENGYLKRKRIALNEQQGSKMEYHIFEKPNQKSENQTFDNQTLENRTQVNTNLKVNTEQKLNYIPKNQKNDFSAEDKINDIEVIEPEEVEYLTQFDKDFALLENKIKIEIDKQQKKEKEKSCVKKEKEYSDEVYQCYEDCKLYFEKDLLPNNPNEYENWFDCIDKLNRIDGLAFSDILLIVKSARSDKFWSKNFLSLTKLRRKDKDKIPYWKVFKERFKFEKSKSECTFDAMNDVLKDIQRGNF